MKLVGSSGVPGRNGRDRCEVFRAGTLMLNAMYRKGGADGLRGDGAWYRADCPCPLGALLLLDDAGGVTAKRHNVVMVATPEPTSERNGAGSPIGAVLDPHITSHPVFEVLIVRSNAIDDVVFPSGANDRIVAVV